MTGPEPESQGVPDPLFGVVPLGLARIQAGESIRVGARLVGADPSSITLADALCQQRFSLAPGLRPPEAQEGDWVVARIEPKLAGHVCGHLELATPTQVPSLEATETVGVLARARILAAVRGYFGAQEFLEVQTPTFGRCPGLDPYVHSLSAVTPSGPEPQYLMTSPELFMKRLLVRGFPRIYQICPAFRAEELGRLHEPEFTLVEWYRSFQGMEAILDDIEEVVCLAALALRPHEDPWLPAPGSPTKRILLRRPFSRMTVADAFHEFAPGVDALDLAGGDPDGYFQLFVDRVEPGLAQLAAPVFLTHFPSNQAALARLSEDDPRVAERFELTLGGVELCNGYVELTQESEQRERFEREQVRRAQNGEPVYPIDERFLSALRAGMPPCTGVALGLDRLVALAAGLERVAAAMAFSAEDH